MKNDLNDFDIIKAKVKDLGEGSLVLLRKDAGLQEYRVISSKSNSGKMIIKLRDLFSLDCKTIEVEPVEECYLVVVKQERKLVTENQLLYRGHH
jgi:hypothetical protein